MFNKKKEEVKIEVKDVSVKTGPKANNTVETIQMLEAELKRLKQKHCSHATSNKNGIKYSMLIISMYGPNKEEDFHKCVHCGANIIPTGWKLAES